MVVAMKRGGAGVLSYLLFEGAYCQELMLGYDDAMKKSEAIKAFLHISETYCDNVVAFKKA